MPRSARLEALGVLHHVMARGIERRRIFRDDVDRGDFVARLSSHCRNGDVAVFAWSLMPNHAHILLRTVGASLSHVMQCVLGGYARRFNLRYRRQGHLFQNRFKSIVVESDPYLLELVLGSNEFVAALQAHEIEQRSLRIPVPSETSIPTLLQEVATRWRIPVAELCSGSKRRPVVEARTEAAIQGVREHGLTTRDLALALGVRPRSVARLLSRGQGTSRPCRAP